VLIRELATTLLF